MEPRIVWPAPGLPALLAAGERQVQLLVSCENQSLTEVRAWARQLTLGARDLAALPLAADRVEAFGADDSCPWVDAFMRLPEAAGRSYVRITCRIPAMAGPRPPRTVRVLDIRLGDRVLRRNAIAVTAPGRDQLSLIFASDMHVAAIWDDLAAAVERHALELAPAFLHPGRQLEALVADANALARRGDLDLVVFGGDLIDHVHEHSRNAPPPTSLRTNYDRFLGIVGELEVPMLTLPGNHDFRLFPWRPRLHNLIEVGLPQDRVRAVLRRAGLWDRWPVRVSDRDLLRTEESGGRPALAHYLTHVAPATDYSIDMRGLRLVFVSTGRDVLPRWREVDAGRRGLLWRSLPTSRHDPDCEGLHEEQVAHVGDGLAGMHRGAAVFMHAPLLHDRAAARLDGRLQRLDPGDRDDHAARVAFERRLHATGLRCGVFFRNPGPLVRALATVAAPVVVFAGHVHHASAIAFDPASLRVRSTPVTAPRGMQRMVTLLTAPSVGHRRPEEAAEPGYLFARFDAGRATVLAERRVIPGREFA